MLLVKKHWDSAVTAAVDVVAAGNSTAAVAVEWRIVHVVVQAFDLPVLVDRSSAEALLVRRTAFLHALHPVVDLVASVSAAAAC